MGPIVSHPLLREAAVIVCLPLFPTGSGASFTLELTDNKCLKTTPISPPYIFLGVRCVIQTWSYSYFKRVLEGTHLSQG